MDIGPDDTRTVSKHKKKWSTSLVITEMQIKSMMRYHHTPVRMAITSKKNWQVLGKKEQWKSYMAHGKAASWPLRKPVSVSHKAQHILIIWPLYPTPALSTQEKWKLRNTQKSVHECSEEDLFAFASKWKQPKCPTSEWVNNGIQPSSGEKNLNY